MDTEEKSTLGGTQDPTPAQPTAGATAGEQKMVESTAAAQAAVQPAPRPTKFCSHCGKVIDAQAVICPLCGCQVEQFTTASPNVVINNNNTNTNTQVQKQRTAPVMVVRGQPKNKWVAVLLCFFLGFFGVHKFYEGKIGMGVLYLFTGGLCGIGTIVDFIALLFKPNPYYV